MKAKKAIEILTARSKDFFPEQDPDLRDAIKLAIEALKRCRVLSQESPLWALQPLPGETPENE